jgi:hypothetical protein
MSTQDTCCVCAEALEWTAFGPCGHKDACSRCVARLRFVLEDKRCVHCRQEHDAVFMTRFAGDYTARPPDFEALAASAAAASGGKGGKGGGANRNTNTNTTRTTRPSSAHGLYELPEVGGFFDDQDHYEYIKKLCSYTHPVLARGGGGAADHNHNHDPSLAADPSGGAPLFASLAALQKRVAEDRSLHFCALCLKGRRVFICEQVLYTRKDLERHHRTGDDAGPLADAGFKGHPLCRFCSRRFYDAGEIYRHMESAHEHCYLCRRERPGSHVYFRDYGELEGHFRTAHHPCPHPSCLEKKFVVFSSEAELKRHAAQEHGGELGMSRAARREAMALPVELRYSTPAGGGGGGGRRGGGGREGGGGGSGGGMRHSRSESAMADGGASSSPAAAAAAEPPPSSVTFSAADFPAAVAAGAAGGPGGGGGGASAAAAGASAGGMSALGTWVGGSSGATRGQPLRAEDFPALPTASRGQRRRAREQDEQRQQLAQRVSAASVVGPGVSGYGNVRIVHRSGVAAAAAGSSAAPRTAAAATSARSASTGELAAMAGAAAAAPPPPPVGELDPFPALGGGGGGSGGGNGGGNGDDDAGLAHPGWVPVRTRAPRPSASPSAPPPRPPPRPEEFPTLAGGVAAAATGRGVPPPPSRAPAYPRPSAPDGSAPPTPSQAMRAANKALMEKVRARLAGQGEGALAAFKQASADFALGGTGGRPLPAAVGNPKKRQQALQKQAAEYHATLVRLGLMPVAAELAALLHEDARRAALIASHRAFLSTPAAHDPSTFGGSGGSGWVPPEAALELAGEAERRSAWLCGGCRTVNAPSARACEECGLPIAVGKAKAAAAAAAAATASGAAFGDAPALPMPTAAAVVGGGGGGGSAARGSAAVAGPSSSSSSFSRPAAQGTTAAARLGGGGGAAPPPPSEASWPGLPGARPAPRPAAPAAAPEPEPAPAAAAAGGKKGKGKKMGLGELLQQGRTDPRNPWSQPGRTQAAVAGAGAAGPSSSSGGGAAGPPATASKGQWKQAGGLAKQMGAINDAYGRR